MPSLLAERTEAGLNPRQEAAAGNVKVERVGRGRALLVLRGLVGIVALAAVWQIAPNVGLVDPYFVSPLSEVLAAWWDLLVSGQLWTHLSASLVRSAAGFGLALAIAIPLGTAIAWYRPVRELVSPVLELFRNTAALALLPVFVLILGIGETSKIAIVLYACFFPILLNTISGVAVGRPAAAAVGPGARAVAGRRRSARWSSRRRCRPSSPASGSPAPPRSWC